MKRILTYNFEKDEIIYIELVQEACNLVCILPYVCELDYNPFKKIRGNAFSLEDVRLAEICMKEAVEQKISFYEHTEGEYAKGVVANCKLAWEKFSEFAEKVRNS